MIARRLWILFVFVAAAAGAQYPDPEDFVEPAQLGHRPLFISRLLFGAVVHPVDHYRPLGQDVAVLHLVNSFYSHGYQLDYKHTEVRGEDNGPLRLVECDCQGGPLYFPTPPPKNALPAAPLPAPKDTVQFGWYVPVGGPGTIPISLRVRATWSRQQVETVIASRTGAPDERLRGREQSFGIESDAFVPIRGRRISGTLHFARTEREGTKDNRSQNELVYISRFPALSLGTIIVRPTLGIGGVTNRDGTAINVVNPTVEAFWHHGRSRVNVHLVLSSMSLNSGVEGWTNTQQVAIYADRSLCVLRFNGGGCK